MSWAKGGPTGDAGQLEGHSVAKPSIPSLKTRVGVGAAAVLAAGAMAAAGIATASAAPTPSPISTAAPSTGANGAAKAGQGTGGLKAFLNLQADSPQSAGDRAAKAAATLVAHPRLFAKLPASLQADVTTLKDAPAADRVKDAYMIKTTALSGGYGTEIQQRAQAFEKTATAMAGLRQELRTAFTSATPGAGLQKIADQLISHPKLFAKLPTNLQADLTALKNASAVEVDGQAGKIKDTALNGGYGAKLQKMAQSLEKKATAPAT
jgi:hypothetical protein